MENLMFFIISFGVNIRNIFKTYFKMNKLEENQQYILSWIQTQELRHKGLTDSEIDELGENPLLKDCVRNADRLYKNNNINQAIKEFKSCLKILQTLPKQKAEIFILIGNCYSDLSKFMESNLNYKMAKKQTKYIKDINIKIKINAIAIGNISGNFIGMGKRIKAIRYCEKSLSYYRRINHTLGIGNQLYNLGIFNIHYGSRPKALEYFIEAQEKYEKIDNKMGIANVLFMKGEIDNFNEQFGSALTNYNKALTEYKINNHKINIAKVHSVIGILHFKKEEYDKALSSLFEAKKINKDLGLENDMGINLGDIALCYLQKRECSSASNFCEEALNIFERFDDKINIGNQYGNKSHIAFLCDKDINKALFFCMKALKTHKKIGYKVGIAKQLCSLALLYSSNSKYKKGIRLFKKGIRIFNSLGDKISINRATEQMLELKQKIIDDKNKPS